MPGSSTTPGRLGARVHAPIRVAFRIRNGVGTRDNNLCEAQWLACAFPYRRFAAVLTDDRARLGADVVSYSFTVSDLHRLLVAGLPAHCERSWLDPSGYDAGKKIKGRKRHIPVDTLGLLLNVVVHPADIQDRDGAFHLLRRARRLFPFIERIFADGGYAGRKMAMTVWRTGA